MLSGLDDIEWADHEGAYGPCEEAPGILRSLASRDAETAGAGLFEFGSSIWHQGTVYPVTAAVVPFLVELATTAGVHDRPDLLHLLGAMADPDRSHGAALPTVRAALARHTGTLLTQLEDPDPGVRACAAYTVFQCGPAVSATLERRWGVETDPAVRASLLLALADPDLPRAAAVTEPFPVPVAAAVALARSGRGIPADAVAAIADAFADDRQWEGPWCDEDPLAEVLDLVDPVTADALSAAMTVRSAPPAGRRGRSAGVKARVRSAEALMTAFGRSRSAPVRMMPQLRALLVDPEPEVQAVAAMAAAHAGASVAAVAGELVRLAFGELNDRRYGAAHISLATLIRLGDRRWHEPLLAAWSAGRDPWAVGLIPEHDPAFDAEIFAAARRRLTAGVTGNNAIHVVNLFAAWGPAAAPAVPEILAALRSAPTAVCGALASIGAAAPGVVPALRQACEAPQPGHVGWPNAGTDRVRAGHALWRVTGDPEPLVAAARALLTTADSPGHIWELDRMADAGPAAAPLLPALLPVLTGRAARSLPERESQIGAARVVWRATGDVAAVLPTVEAVLRAGDSPVRAATALAADLAAADPGTNALAPALRAALRGEWGRVAGARALWRLGADPAELIKALLGAAEDPYTARDAVALLVEMDASAAVPALTRLAEQDERIGGSTDDHIWIDERLRRDLHTAVGTLTALAARKDAGPQ